MAETYTIPVRLDLSRARSDAQKLDQLLADVENRSTRSEAKRAQATERSADAAVRAEQRKVESLDRLQDQLILRDIRRRTRHEALKERESERAQAREIANAERATAQKERLAEREAERKTRLAQREAERLDRIQDQFLMRDMRRRNAYEAQQQRAADKTAAAQAKAMASGERNAGLFGDAVGRVAGAFAGMFSAAAVVSAIGVAMRDAKAEATAMATALIDAQSKLRPLAGVMGRRPDVAFAIENAMLGAGAGMTPDQASEFREMFRGRAQIVAGKTITQDEFQQFELLSAGMAAAKGIPAEQAGNLFGGVLKAENFTNRGLAGKGEQASAAAATAARLFEVMDASSAPMPIATHQASQLMAFVNENQLESRINKATDVGVLIGTASEMNPQEAFTLASMQMRALSDFGNKDKQPFFKAAGINDKTGTIEATLKANKYFEAQVAKGIPLDVAISQAGFDSIREGRALGGFFNARDTMLGPLLAMANAPLDMTAPGKMVSDHLASAPGVQATGKSLLAAAQHVEGNRGAAFEAAIPAAQARLVQKYGTTTPWWARLETLGGIFGMGPDPERYAAEQEAISMAGVKPRQSMRDYFVGAAIPGVSGLTDIASNWFDYYSGGYREKANEALGGGGTTPELAAQMKRLSEVLDRLSIKLPSAAPIPFVPGKVNPGLAP